MKVILTVVTILTLAIACRKNLADAEITKGPMLEGSLRPLIPLIEKTITSRVCITNFQEAANALGATGVAISSVVLLDGSTVTTGGNVERITLEIAPSSGGNSLFTSRLLVAHKTYGIVQTLGSEVWSLGCVLQGGDGGTLTNVLTGNTLLYFNTCFNWGVPPYNFSSPRIKYLVK